MNDRAQLEALRRDLADARAMVAAIGDRVPALAWRVRRHCADAVEHLLHAENSVTCAAIELDASRSPR